MAATINNKDKPVLLFEVEHQTRLVHGTPEAAGYDVIFARQYIEELLLKEDFASINNDEEYVNMPGYCKAFRSCFYVGVLNILHNYINNTNDDDDNTTIDDEDGGPPPKKPATTALPAKQRHVFLLTGRSSSLKNGFWIPEYTICYDSPETVVV